MSALLERVRACVGEGSLLAIDAGALAPVVLSGSVREVPAPETEPVDLPDGAFDAVLIGGLGGASPLALARAAAPRVGRGGRVVFALATTRPGLKGTAGSLLGMIRRRRPVMLEELCEALLVAGLREITADELDGSSGHSVVCGRAR